MTRDRSHLPPPHTCVAKGGGRDFFPHLLCPASSRIDDLTLRYIFQGKIENNSPCFCQGFACPDNINKRAEIAIIHACNISRLPRLRAEGGGEPMVE